MNQTRNTVEQPNTFLESLRRASHILESGLDDALDANGLSRAKLGVLMVLAGESDPLPLGQLAERLTCVKSNITQLVDRLEADGLVERLRDAGDRRSTRAAITEEGRRRYATGMEVKLALEQELLHRLSPDEQDMLGAALAKLSAD